ncbi:MAG: serine/threonine protein kinase [Myxococcales bacterium]|nr:serine/threonine protein kinase [Myxococcales bacterium]
MTARDAAQQQYERFGAYELLERLGVGGMAEVFLARHLDHPEQLVALKRVLPHFADSSVFSAMFLDEVRIAERLSHPNIVGAYESGRGPDGRAYLALEFVHGRSLEDIHKLVAAGSGDRHEGLAVLLFVVRCVAEALAYAHEQRDADGLPSGIVHRDVSPTNVLVGFDGSVKLIDFGVAKSRARLVQTSGGQLKGRLAYMSPEQASGGAVDQRSDLFSLGVVLYEMLTNVKLFGAPNDIACLDRVINAYVPDPSDVANVPQSLSLVTLRALERDVELRFQNARQLADALDAAIAGADLITDAVAVSRWMHRHAAATQDSPAIHEAVAAHVPFATASTIKGARADDAGAKTLQDALSDDGAVVDAIAAGEAWSSSPDVGAITELEVATAPAPAHVRVRRSLRTGETETSKTLEDMPAPTELDDDEPTIRPQLEFEPSTDVVRDGHDALPATDAKTVEADVYDPGRTLPPHDLPVEVREAVREPARARPASDGDEAHPDAWDVTTASPAAHESGPLPAIQVEDEAAARRRAISLAIAIVVLLASSIVIFVLIASGD